MEHELVDIKEYNKKLLKENLDFEEKYEKQLDQQASLNEKVKLL